MTTQDLDNDTVVAQSFGNCIEAWMKPKSHVFKLGIASGLRSDEERTGIAPLYRGGTRHREVRTGRLRSSGELYWRNSASLLEGRHVERVEPS